MKPDKFNKLLLLMTRGYFPHKCHIFLDHYNYTGHNLELNMLSIYHLFEFEWEGMSKSLSFHMWISMLLMLLL